MGSQFEFHNFTNNFTQKIKLIIDNNQKFFYS